MTIRNRPRTQTVTTQLKESTSSSLASSSRWLLNKKGHEGLYHKTRTKHNKNTISKQQNHRLRTDSVTVYGCGFLFGCTAMGRASASVASLTWGFGLLVGALCLSLAGPPWFGFMFSLALAVCAGVSLWWCFALVLKPQCELGVFLFVGNNGVWGEDLASMGCILGFWWLGLLYILGGDSVVVGLLVCCFMRLPLF